MSKEALRRAILGADLVDVRVSHLEGKLCSREDESESSEATVGAVEEEAAERQTWRLSFSTNPDHESFDITLDLWSDTNAAQFRAVITGHFHYECSESNEEPPEEVMVEFFETEGYPSLAPFVRESTADLARRLNTRSPKIARRQRIHDRESSLGG
ncbi:hypothetical protein [Saccharomonospora halophila]|uniref:hypothetical protein n=1 Tax=Saccharomonospora halophila TaxID=129922 RepID=UPI0012FC6AE1|nr:hypothetical protein [Saccharomonospora halophila]